MATDATHFLTIAPACDMALGTLISPLRSWFASSFGKPTLAQRYAWPTIQRREHLLLSSPTGSGKTFAAFLPIISDLLATPSGGLQCLYIAPLKALGRDVRVNLKKAWRSLQNAGHFTEFDLRIGLRTGDTSQRVRRRQLSDPPPILLTTPESLAQMLAQPSARELFASLRWVILDEIHALCDNKRGADLAISLERLDALNNRDARIQRIGLSATCAPLTAVAEFLVGAGRSCTIALVRDETQKCFTVEPLFENVENAPSWMAALMDRLHRELLAGQTTLIFTNTRSLAERITWALKRRHPDRCDEIAVHHSAISAARRRSVERRLKHGRLWTVVCSTSLELGIDIGTVDNVVFVHPPGGVVRLLQRVGRSGHRPDQPRRGLLLTASPGELLEAAVTASSGRDGRIETVRIVDAPLDVLCQQLVGMSMTDAWSPDAANELVRRAAPYRHLAWSEFQDCLDYLAGLDRDAAPRGSPRGCNGTAIASPLPTNGSPSCCAATSARYSRKTPARSACARRPRPMRRACRRSARSICPMPSVCSPATASSWMVVALKSRSTKGKRCSSMKCSAGRRFRAGKVRACRCRANWPAASSSFAPTPPTSCVRAIPRCVIGCTMNFVLTTPRSSRSPHLSQQETVSEIPTLAALLIEGVALQSCREYFVHTPLPRSANEAMVRVLLHRWRSSGKPAATALVADLGFYLVVHQTAPTSPDAWRDGLRAASFAEDLHEHLRDSQLLRQQFAGVAQTGLMVLRNPAGRKRKVGGKDWTQRRLFDQIRNRMPDFVLLRQTERETTSSACNLEQALAYVANLASMQIRIRHLPLPSPFGESLLRVGFAGAAISGEPSAEYAEVS